MKIERWCIIPDLQIPFEDKRSLTAVESYMAAHRWDGYLQLGDLLDLNELSSYVKGKPGAVTEELADSFAAGREILKRHAQIIRKNNVNARMIVLQGNHDYRAVAYAEEHPGLKEHLDVPKNLGLADLDIEWIESWAKGKLFKIGHAYFLHGNYTNKHYAATMVDAYGCNVYFGHNHSVQFFSKMTKGHGETFEAGSLGCLCRYDQAYMQGKPHSWQQAVTTLFVRQNGDYNLLCSRIFKHTFTAPDGETYAG